MKLVLLGVIGPTQVLLGILIPIGIIALIVYLIMSNSKNKAKAQTLENVLSQQGNKNILDDLERLEKLKISGGLTEAEFEAEKRKLLNKSY
jgi:septation ring formation regulator EzrA